MCSKLAAKEMAREAVGSGKELLIAQPVWRGGAQAVCQAVADTPHGQWILKPDDLGGSVVHFFSDQESRSAEALKQFLSLCRTEHRLTRRIGPRYWRPSLTEFFIEPRLGQAPELLDDYRVHVIGSSAVALDVYTHRDGNLSMARFRVPIESGLIAATGPDPCSLDDLDPNVVERMVSLAEHLTCGLTYIRVDFYYVDGKIWFGELTPAAAYVRSLMPDSLNLEWGTLWNAAIVAKQRHSAG
jgi:hypothetical protein